MTSREGPLVSKLPTSGRSDNSREKKMPPKITPQAKSRISTYGQVRRRRGLGAGAGAAQTAAAGGSPEDIAAAAISGGLTFAIYVYFMAAPPLGFQVSDPQDIIDLTVFLVVAVLTGHQEPSLEEKLQKFSGLLGQMYTVKPLTLQGKAAVDEDVDVVFVMGPQADLQPNELKALDQFPPGLIQLKEPDKEQHRNKPPEKNKIKRKI